MFKISTFSSVLSRCARTFLEWLAAILSATRMPQTFGLTRHVAPETKAELQLEDALLSMEHETRAP